MQGYEKTKSKRQSYLVSGERSGLYIHGQGTKQLKRKLLANLYDPKCDWCGAVSTSSGRGNVIEVHHKDHNQENSDISNLGWLCRNCNCLEGQAWTLQKAGLAKWGISGNALIVVFNQMCNLS